MSKAELSGEFTLEGDTFSWVCKRYAGEVSPHENFRGLNARVTLAGAKCRELVVEFAPHAFPPKGPVSVPQFVARLQECTAAAMAAGWRPDSRGKPFWFAADA